MSKATKKYSVLIGLERGNTATITVEADTMDEGTNSSLNYRPVTFNNDGDVVAKVYGTVVAWKVV